MVEFFVVSIIAVGVVTEAVFPVISSSIDMAAPYVDQGIDAVKGIIK